MDGEWGPWIEHDGKGCPCVGMMVHRVFDTEFDRLVGESVSPTKEHISICTDEEIDSWNGNCDHIIGYIPQVIHYRIRKPRALLDMIERARELDDDKIGELECM